ncbi:MAG: hypothetical protein IPJ17_17890 [Holophagales bacterium]|nr:MAG: hypothetical protein IPJ17_17890 [Holophagales bacterium]
MQAIDADGTVVCSALNGPPTISTLYDTGWTAGTDTSIAIGGDRVPVISHAVNGGAG